MRRTKTLILAAAAVAFCIAGPGQSLAQTPTLYAGLGYNDHWGDPGILFGAVLPVGPVDVGGDFTWLLVDDFNVFTIDVNGRYPVFQAPGGPKVSVTAGVQIDRWSIDVSEFSESGTEIGPTAGARVDYSLGSIGVFGQAQYVIAGESDGLTGGAGVTFTP